MTERRWKIRLCSGFVFRAVLACGDGPTGVRSRDLTLWSDSGTLWVKNRGPETVYYLTFMADFIFSASWQPCTEVETPSSRCPHVGPGETIGIPYHRIQFHPTAGNGLVGDSGMAVVYWWTVFDRGGVVETQDLAHVFVPLR